MSCVLMGVPVREGTGRAGADAGPRALRAAGIGEALRGLGLSVTDRGNLEPHVWAELSHGNAALKALPEVAAWTRAIAAAVGELPRGQIPVILGGDHSLAMGTLTGLSRRAAGLGRKLFVLWIDAHPDCHTLETSTSGHIHGTPVAYALGLPGFGPAFAPVTHPLAASDICMVGIRSIDAAEADVIAREGLEVHSAADVAARGVSAIIQPFLERVRAENGMLHVSFDVDSVDPAHAPGVGTPVPGGLSIAEARRIMAEVRESGMLSSLDMVELNPFLDRDRRTSRLMVELAAQALGPAAIAKEARIA